MPSINLWSRSVSRVELDQRSREARLRLERIEPLVVSRATVAHSWFWRLVGLFNVGSDRRAPQGKRVRRPLNNRRPSRVPTILNADPPAPGIAMRHHPPKSQQFLEVSNRIACFRKGGDFAHRLGRLETLMGLLQPATDPLAWF